MLWRPDGRAEWLTPRPGAFDGVRSLDGAWLEATFADTPAEVEYQHGLTEVGAVLARRRRDGGGADPTGEHRRDRAHRPGGALDAAQVDVLHPQAADRVRRPPLGCRARLAGLSRPQGSSAARAASSARRTSRRRVGGDDALGHDLRAALGGAAAAEEAPPHRADHDQVAAHVGRDPGRWRVGPGHRHGLRAGLVAGGDVELGDGAAGRQLAGRDLAGQRPSHDGEVVLTHFGSPLRVAALRGGGGGRGMSVSAPYRRGARSGLARSSSPGPARSRDGGPLKPLVAGP